MEIATAECSSLHCRLPTPEQECTPTPTSQLPTQECLDDLDAYLLDHIVDFPHICHDALIERLWIVMFGNIFTFSDTYWRQRNGASMGAPPCPADTSSVVSNFCAPRHVVSSCQSWIPFSSPSPANCCCHDDRQWWLKATAEARYGTTWKPNMLRLFWPETYVGFSHSVSTRFPSSKSTNQSILLFSMLWCASQPWDSRTLCTKCHSGVHNTIEQNK